MSYAIYICAAILFPIQEDSDRAGLVREWKRLEGVWELKRFVLEGKEQPVRRLDGKAIRVKITIQGIMATLFEGEASVEISRLALFPTRIPKEIDIKIIPLPDVHHAGIYEINNNVFKYCTGRKAGIRPTEFVSAPNAGGYSLEVWERVK